MPRRTPYLALQVRPRLREIRGDRRLQEMASTTGVSAPTLSQLEHGHRLPRPQEMEPLERGYGPRSDWYAVELVSEDAA